MCNLYTTRKSVDEVAAIFRGLQMPLRFPEGVPNLRATDIRITDPGPIVRAAAGHAASYELMIRRWSWPGPSGKPVFNFRSEGREFSSGRCLIIADGFYEFTATEPRQKKKDRWLFQAAGRELIAIAGLVRAVPKLGEAFTMLTTEPGADVAPYHDRQVVVLQPTDWKLWLDGSPAQELLRPAPAGSLISGRA